VRGGQAEEAVIASGGVFPEEQAPGDGEMEYVRKKWCKRFEWVESVYADALFQVHRLYGMYSMHWMYRIDRMDRIYH